MGGRQAKSGTEARVDETTQQEDRNTSLPKMHTKIQWSRKTYLYTLQIYVCINYNVQISFQKFFSIVFF